jgi:hypothetical protein
VSCRVEREQVLIGLMLVANGFGLEHLRSLSGWLATRCVTVDNVALFLTKAHALNVDNLFAFCMAFILDHYTVRAHTHRTRTTATHAHPPHTPETTGTEGKAQALAGGAPAAQGAQGRFGHGRRRHHLMNHPRIQKYTKKQEALLLLERCYMATTTHHPQPRKRMVLSSKGVGAAATGVGAAATGAGVATGAMSAAGASVEGLGGGTGRALPLLLPARP